MKDQDVLLTTLQLIVSRGSLTFIQDNANVVLQHCHSKVAHDSVNLSSV